MTTTLIRVKHWGVCPVHNADFLENIRFNARAILGIQTPELLDRGLPSRPGS